MFKLAALIFGIAARMKKLAQKAPETSNHGVGQ
jgi:hypothetical protein